MNIGSYWKNVIGENKKEVKELDEKGIQPHLDGENHYQDIDDWHKMRVKEIKRKYFG